MENDNMKTSGPGLIDDGNGTDKDFESGFRKEYGDYKNKNRGKDTGIQGSAETSLGGTTDTAWRMANPFAKMSRLSRSPPRERCGSFGDAEEMIKRYRRINEMEKKSGTCKMREKSVGKISRAESRTASSADDKESESEAEVMIVEGRNEDTLDFDSSYTEPSESNEGGKKRKAKTSPRAVYYSQTSAITTLKDQSTKLADFAKKNKNVHKEVKTMAADIASLVKQSVREFETEKNRCLDLEEEIKSMRKRQEQLEKEVGRLANLVTQLTSKVVPDSSEGIYIVRESTAKNDTKEQYSQTEMTESGTGKAKGYKEVGTQTNQTPWEKGNEDIIKRLKTQIATRRGYEGWSELELREWPLEMFTVVREVEGNPIWETEEQNLVALLGKQDKMDKGISRQVRRRFPEIEQIQRAQTESGCSCLVYEARLFAAGETSSPGRRTLTRVTIGEDDRQNYMNILSWKEKAMALGIDRAATFVTEDRWSQIMKMIEHVFWGTKIKILAYSAKKGSTEKGQRSQKRDNSGKAQLAREKNQRRPHDAVVVNGKNKTYAELLRSVKEKIKPDTLGIKIMGARSTKTGDLLLTLDKEEGNAVKLKEAIDKELAQEGVVTRMGNQTEVIIHIKDLDVTTTEQEIKTNVAAVIKAEEGLIQVKSLRPAYGQRQNATIAVQKEIAEKLIQKGRIRIGWSMCRIQERMVVRRCARCWGFGHNTRSCKGVNRSENCLRCAKVGHKVKECNDEPYCPICEKHGHRADSMACPVYRRETEKGMRKAPENMRIRRERKGDSGAVQVDVDMEEMEESGQGKETQARKVDLGDQPNTFHND